MVVGSGPHAISESPQLGGVATPATAVTSTAKAGIKERILMMTGREKREGLGET
jgi:hypothetical protein